MRKYTGLLTTGFCLSWYKGKYMTHYLNLWDDSFQAIKEGWKTIDMRLLDEKRVAIKLNDTIEFSNVKTEEKLKCKVICLYKYHDFYELYKYHDKRSIGYKDNEDANPEDMFMYYSQDMIKKYGVIGIGLSVVEAD